MNDMEIERLRTLIKRMRQRGQVFGAQYGCYTAPADPEIMKWADELESILEALLKRND